MAELSKDEFSLLCDLWTRIQKVSRGAQYLDTYYYQLQDKESGIMPRMLGEMVLELSRIKMDLMGFIEQDQEEAFVLTKMLTEQFDANNEGWAEN